MKTFTVQLGSTLEITRVRAESALDAAMRGAIKLGVRDAHTGRKPTMMCRLRGGSWYQSYFFDKACSASRNLYQQVFVTE